MINTNMRPLIGQKEPPRIWLENHQLELGRKLLFILYYIGLYFSIFSTFILRPSWLIDLCYFSFLSSVCIGTLESGLVDGAAGAAITLFIEATDTTVTADDYFAYIPDVEQGLLMHWWLNILLWKMGVSLQASGHTWNQEDTNLKINKRWTVKNSVFGPWAWRWGYVWTRNSVFFCFVFFFSLVLCILLFC